METAVVDALDPESVGAHADRVAAEAGRIDICFNLISHGDVHGTPLIEMDMEHFVRPIDSIVAHVPHLTGNGSSHGSPRRRRHPHLRWRGRTDAGLLLGGTWSRSMPRRRCAANSPPSWANKARVMTIITGGILETIGDDADPTIAQGLSTPR